MSKVKTSFRCSACSTTAPQWAGRCAGCGEWNTLIEETPVAGRMGTKSTRVASKPVSLNAAVAEIAVTYPTGVVEVDRVLGGGLTRGSVTLLGGEPGIGKSTLVLQLCAGLAEAGQRCLVVTGEESAEQVGRRAKRLGVNHDGITLLAENDVDVIMQVILQERPNFVIVDSVQTMASAAINSASGSVSQVREVAQAFTQMAKSQGIAVMLIGHVTKEGALAGPRVLEHVVDTVLEFEGDRHQGLRFLRAVKHRFGATDEVGVLSMVGSGLQSVADASGLFLDDRRLGNSGSIVAPVLEGRRPVLVEVQSLVELVNPSVPQPRRVAQGLDSSRFAVIVAVLGRKAHFPVSAGDIFTSVVGGIRVSDPGVDLAIALAIASAASDHAIDGDVIAVGEIGLGGEVRKVPQLEKRLGEAQRMGFKRALVPIGFTGSVPGMKIKMVDSVRDALDSLGIRNPQKQEKALDTED